ncbi:MAG: hypothetical protein AB1758_07445, partial [Candidatus Eremiobacterota bacterium]
MQIRRGSALVMILAMVAVLSVLAASVGSVSTQNLRSTTTHARGRQMDYAALSGIQVSLGFLSQDPNHKTPVQGSLPTLSRCDYDVQVVNNYDGSMGDPYVGPNGVTVPKGTVYLTSVGRNGTHASAPLSALAYREDVTLNTAAFGHKSVDVVGSNLSSWDVQQNGIPQEFLPPPPTATTAGGRSLKMSMSMSKTGT